MKAKITATAKYLPKKTLTNIDLEKKENKWRVNNSTSFNGVWNVYPFFSSGVILISDINSGLFIVKSSNDL